MMYENYGLGIFGHAHSVKLGTDGKICFYFTDMDSRDRALGRIRSLLKIEGKLPVSELCKYHKLLHASEHDSDRGWTKEDLDESGIIGYDLSVNTYEIAFPTPRNFESPEETKETTTDGDLGAFRNAFSFEETSDKGLKFSFKSRDDRDRAYEAFKNCLLSKKQITTSDLEMCLLNFSSDWAIFVMALFAIWPSDLGWEKEDLICVDRWASCPGVDDDEHYDLFLPAPRKLEPKDVKMDKSKKEELVYYTGYWYDLLKPFEKAYGVSERMGSSKLYTDRIDIAFKKLDDALDAANGLKETLQKGSVGIINIKYYLPMMSYTPRSNDHTYGWTKDDIRYIGLSGVEASLFGGIYTLSLPAPHEISRSDMDPERLLYPFKKAVNVHKRWDAINDSFSIAIDFCTEEDRDYAAEGFKKLISPDNGSVTAGDLRSFLPKNLGDNDSLKRHATMRLSWNHGHLNEIHCYTYMCGAGWRYAVALPSLTEEDGGDQNGTEGNVEADSTV